MQRTESQSPSLFLYSSAFSIDKTAPTSHIPRDIRELRILRRQEATTRRRAIATAALQKTCPTPSSAARRERAHP